MIASLPSHLSLSCANSNRLLQRFTDTDEGLVKHYFGCQLIRNQLTCTSQLVQTAYTKQLLSTFDMWDEVRTIATHILPGTHLVKADCPDTPRPTLQRRYTSIVGSISYLVQMT